MQTQPMSEPKGDKPNGEYSNRTLPSCQNCINRQSQCTYPLTAEKPGPKPGMYATPEAREHEQRVRADVFLGAKHSKKILIQPEAQPLPEYIEDMGRQFPDVDTQPPEGQQPIENLHLGWEQLQNTNWLEMTRDTRYQPVHRPTRLQSSFALSEVEREEIRRWESKLNRGEYAAKESIFCQGLHHALNW